MLGTHSGSIREEPIAKKIVWPRGEYPVEDGKVIIDGKAYKDEVTIILQQRPMESFEDLYALCSEQAVLDEDDPKGFYKVVHEGVFYTPVPILPPDGKVWLKVGAESTIEINSTQYFFVPEDCEQFQLSFLPTYEKRRFYSKLRLAAGAIVNPDSKAVAAMRVTIVLFQHFRDSFATKLPQRLASQEVACCKAFTQTLSPKRLLRKKHCAKHRSQSIFTSV